MEETINDMTAGKIGQVEQSSQGKRGRGAFHQPLRSFGFSGHALARYSNSFGCGFAALCLRGENLFVATGALGWAMPKVSFSRRLQWE
jgi:hypothetical protein